jgi:hypothetical protein
MKPNIASCRRQMMGYFWETPKHNSDLKIARWEQHSGVLTLCNGRMHCDERRLPTRRAVDDIGGH